MTHSTRLSSRSAQCHLEWRPSRWLIMALAGLGLCAAIAVLASDIPDRLAWPCALLAAIAGMWCARRELRRPHRQLLIRGAPPRPVVTRDAQEAPADDGPGWTGAEACTVDGLPVQGLVVQWRGPLAFLSWRDATGRRQRLSWWPDTLPPTLRRELRLAAPAAVASRHRRSVAP